MMSAKFGNFAVRASVLAVQGALVAMMALPAYAAEPTVAELTKPVNELEVGVINVDKSSAKFGEYNGLEKKGASVLGGFDVSGGGGENSALRYRITGTDLGLDTRNLSAEFGEQGRFRINFGYDELTKRSSDSFMTPYNGAGTNTLTLPANWATNSRNCTVSGAAQGNTNFGGASNATTGGTSGCGNYYINQNTGNSTAAPTGNGLALTDAELAAFHHVDLQTQRKRADLGLSLVIDPRWSVSASARHELKEGVQAVGSPAAGTTNAQVTVPNPIKYDTNEFNLKLSFVGEKSFADAAYYGSFFKDRIDGFTYQNPYFSSATQSITSTGAVTFPYADNIRMGTAPDNQFHQLNLTGGYYFDKTTKLVANAAYSRATQNDSYLPYGTGNLEARALPQSSLNGLVVTKSMNLKLTARPIRNVNLGAAYKYDERDNRTPVNTYISPYNPQESQILPLAGTSTTFNLPYSRKIQQLNLDADWAFQKGQSLKAGYEYQKLKRWCDNLPAALPSCVDAVDSKENTWSLDYRNNVLEAVTARVGYAVSKRDASTYLGNPAVYIPAEYKTDVLTRFNMTDRTRDKLRTSVTWQATDAFELTGGFDFTKDDYTLGKNSLSATSLRGFGLDHGKSTALNLDGTYRVSETLSVNAYYSDENISSVLLGNAGNTTAGDWSVDMKDRVKTYGLAFRARELMAGKLDLGGDYVKSDATSPYALSEASVQAITGNTTANSAQNLSAASAAFTFPDTYSRSDTFKLTAKYKVSKSSAWRLTYEYQKLSSADPLRYNGLQQGAATNAVNGSATARVNGTNVTTSQLVPISSLIPTNEQAPNYSVQAIGVAYIYTFQ